MSDETDPPEDSIPYRSTIAMSMYPDYVQRLAPLLDNWLDTGAIWVLDTVITPREREHIVYMAK